MSHHTPPLNLAPPYRGLPHLFALCILGLTITNLAGADTIKTKPFLEYIQSSRAPAGFCVQLGYGDGSLIAALAKNNRLAVHVLEPDEQKVHSARQTLYAQGLYGQIVVEHWTDSFLPYADNLVNLLLVENPAPAASNEAELLRVLVPYGTFWVKQNDRWQSTQKPWPQELDEWTHARHGADGNMVSRDRAIETPTGVRWMAGPAQDPGGRKWYYDHVLVSSAGRNFYVYEEEIVARDAFNGRLLWARPAKAYIFKETGVDVAGLKIGTRTSKVRPVAINDRLYTAINDKLVALDAVNGQTVQTFCEVKTPREIAVAQGILLVTDQHAIRAFALEDGKLRWQHTEPARRIVAGDRRLIFLNQSNVVCLELGGGKEQWRTIEPKATEAQTCALYKNALVLERSAWRDDATGSGLVVFAADTGKLLWSKDYKPGMTHFKEARTCFADDLVWVEMETTNKPTTIKWVGFNPLTGVSEKQVGTRGLHCSAPLATERFFIAGEMEFTDLKTGERSRARMLKSACRLPFIPANGLLYSFPVQCECFPMLRGYIGLAQTPAIRESHRPRLQPGPAFASVSAGDVSPASPADWPMYRHDAYRSGATPATLPEQNLTQLWEKQLVPPPPWLLGSDWKDNPFVPGLLTPPVGAANLLLVAAPDQHCIIALDATTGAPRWTYVAGGRIDSSPTIAGGLCLFGAHDGYVYCLKIADGQLVWRFRAAPHESRMSAYGQMESSWPVPGSVLFENGLVYFAAGRHPLSDSGVRVYALRPHNGEVAWETNLTNVGVSNWYSATFPKTTVKVGLDFEPVDMMVRDGDKIAMSRWRFEPENGAMKLAFTQTNYQASAGLEVPRGLWSYGIRQNKAVLPKPPAVFTGEKLFKGTSNDVALLLAGSTLVKASAKGELKLGSTVIPLPAAPVHDGLMALGGRLYAATRDGKLYCFGTKSLGQSN